MSLSKEAVRLRIRKIKHWLRMGVSKAQIAKKLGISKSAVGQFMKLHKVKTPKKQATAKMRWKIQKIQRLLNAGYYQKDIATEMKLNESYISQIISKFKLKRKKPK